MQKRSIIRRSTILPTEVMAPYWPDTMDLIASDLSPRGMYLISEQMPSVGEFVFCTFQLKRGDPEYRLLSRVNRINWHRRKTDSIRPGFGVEFLGVATDEVQRIGASLIGMPPPIPNRRRRVSPAGLSLPRPTISIPKVPRPSVPTPTAPIPPVPLPTLARGPIVLPKPGVRS